MKKLMVALLLGVAFVFCFNSGFTVAENRSAKETIELLEENIRLQVLVNVYEHKYGSLTGKDAELFFRKSQDNSNGLIGPI